MKNKRKNFRREAGNKISLKQNLKYGGHMKFRIKKFLLLALMLCVMNLLVYSQIREAGSIEGQVTDSSGTPLPGVTVTIQGPSLIGGPKTTITNRNGVYRFPSLTVGEYQVKAEISGFNSVVKKGINLHANMTLTVDFELSQAAIEEEMVVVGESPTVDVKSSATGTVIMTDELLTSVPSNKSYESILNYAPGVNDFNAGGSGYSTPNAYQFEGIDVGSAHWGGLSFSPNYNIVEEANVQSLGLPAEYGHYTGAIFSAITKSGSNQLSAMAEIRFQNKGWNNQNKNDVPEEDFMDPSMKDTTYESPLMYDIGAQLGGKLITDKLWYFLSAEYMWQESYPLGTTVTRKDWSPKLFAKFTYQMNPANEFNLSLNYDNERAENILAGPTVSEEVDINNFYPGFFVNLDWTSIFSGNTFLDVKFGYNWKQLDQIPKAGIDVAGHYDYFTGKYTENYPFFMKSDSDNLQLVAHLSHYIPEFIKGSHDIKIGAEGKYMTSVAEGGLPGAAVYYDWDGGNYLKYEKPQYHFDHYFGTISGFVQDRWSVTKRITFNLGLRYDHYLYRIPSETLGLVYNTGNFAPRLGANFDPIGNGKNVIKFHYGHYYEKLYRSYFYDLEDRGGDLSAYTWNGSEWDLLFIQEAENLYSIDPNVKHPYLREIIAAYERELFPNASLTLSFFHKSFVRTLGAINTGAEYQKVTATNPGPDGVTGTTDDSPIELYEQLNPGESKYLITNPEKGQSDSIIEEPKKDVTGVKVILNKKFANNWQMLASYTYTHIDGNIERLTDPIAEDPNNFVNANGFPFPPHIFKLQGNFILPLDISLGVVGTYKSGPALRPLYWAVLPQGWVQVRPKPWGESRLDPWTNIDLRVEKIFNVGGGDFKVIADVFNLFNSYTPSSYTAYERYYGANYGKIVNVRSPRVFRVGIRFVY